MSTIDTYTAQAALAAIKSALDGGNMYYFAGTEPTSAADALDMDNTHTQLVMMTASGDGSTGLTYADPSGVSMSRNTSETWEGTVAFSGYESGESALTATFWRFCPAGDDGRGAATGVRLQGSLGASGSGASIELNAATTELTAGNTETLGAFSVTMSDISA